LPLSGDLEEGAYTIQAYAVDRAGNTTIAQHHISVDKTAPTINFNMPVDAAHLSALTVVSGTVGDSISGISSVMASIQRLSDAQYWNGFAWQSAPTETVAGVSGATWQWISGLPSGADLPDGDYLLTAVAWDGAENSAVAVISIHIDGTPPSVSITAPSAEAILYCPAYAKGTASDSSGINKVWINLYRFAYGAQPAGFYNFGTGIWGSDAGYVPALATGTENWFKPLPDLEVGNYVLGAYALDNAGNVSFQISRSFSVRRPGLIIWREAPDRVVVSWPVAASCFELQYSEALSESASWNPAGSTVVLVGENWMLTNTIAGPNRFYRLKR
jgi:hypothetical protein